MPAAEPGGHDRGTRLDSWKEIASYLGRDVRTVQRWEKTAGLPVRRLNKPGLRAVYAYAADLDRWRQEQEPGVEARESSQAPVTGPAAIEPEPLGATAPAERPTRWWRYVLAAVAVMALVGLAWRARPTSPAAFGPFTARPITSEPGDERDPDISPDGKYVAYVHETPDRRTSLLVRPVEGGEPRTLVAPMPAGVRSPAWSPDGTHLAFLRGDVTGTASVVLMSALGGDERPVATIQPYPPRRTTMIGHLLAWSPDGRHLIAAHQQSPGRSSLVRIAVDSGQRVPITSPGEAQFDVEPSLSSDGQLLLFSRVRGEFLSDAWVQPLDATLMPSGQPRKLPAAGNWNGTPRLLESRGEVLTSSGAIPRLALYRQPLDGTGTPQAVGLISDNAVESVVDRASGRLVVRTYRLPVDVLRFPATGSTGAPQPPAVEEFLRSTYVDRSGVYSPDGRRVAFLSDRSGSRQVWVSDANGENAVEWAQAAEVAGPMPAWSPDGTRIAVAALGPSGTSQLYTIDGSTRKATRVTDDALDYVRAAWSPDGTFLYAAAANRGSYAIYRVPATGGTAQKVADGYANVVDATPDGRGLYAVRRTEARRLVLVYLPLPNGTPVRLAGLNFIDDAWMTREGLYFLAQREDAQAVGPVDLRFRPHGGMARTLAAYTRPPGRGLSVSPDGRFALTTRIDDVIADLLRLDPAR